MTQKEFEDRTRRLTTKKDYRLIEALYMAAGNMDKNAFCDEFARMNAYDAANDQIELRECLREIAMRVIVLTEQNERAKKQLETAREEVDGKLMELAGFMIGKAHAYNDTDFYKEAVRLIGQAEVTRRTVRMGLPLWEEDKEFIDEMIEQRGKKIVFG